MDEETKPVENAAKYPWESIGIMGGFFSGSATILSLLGHPVSQADAASLTQGFLAVMALAGAAVGIFGRMRAKTKIKFPWSKR